MSANSTQPQAANPLEAFPKLRVWAVVGVSNNREKYGNKIYRDLKAAGYTVYAVNPRLTEVEGDSCYPSLQALPVIPDVVDLVVPPEVVESVIDDCVAKGITRVWFQPGRSLTRRYRKRRNWV